MAESGTTPGADTYDVGGGVTVILDQIDGARATHHIQNGWAISRVAHVAGLNQDYNTTGGELLSAACNALISIVGDRGTPCQGIPVPTYLEQFVPEALSSNVVKVTFLYKGYKAPEFELDTSLSWIESNVDASGNPIFVAYTYPSAYVPNPAKGYSPGAAGHDPSTGLYTDTISSPVSVPTPEVTWTISFLITNGYLIGGLPVSALEAATYISTYEGKVNKTPYAIGLLNGAAHQWLISRARAKTTDGGLAYWMSLTYQLRLQGWDQFVFYRLPESGLPPKDLVQGVGTKTIYVTGEIVFPSFFFGPN